jgi:teichuronic acid biosynthesis glycosyltransferase TuaC
VVATRVGGVPEMLDAGSGVLVEPRSPTALADGVEQALTQSFDRAGLAQRAQERYGRTRVGAELAAAYEAVLAER